MEFSDNFSTTNSDNFKVGASVDLISHPDLALTKLIELANAGLYSIELRLNNSGAKKVDGKLITKTDEELLEERSLKIANIPLLAKQAQEAGIKINSYHLPYGGKDGKISSLNENERQFALQACVEYIKQAEKTNPAYFVIHAGMFANLLRIPTEEDIKALENSSNSQQIAGKILRQKIFDRSQRLETAIKSIATLSRVTNVPLCVENLPFAHLCNTPEEQIYVIDKVNELNKAEGFENKKVYATLDINHCGFGVRAEDAILKLNDRLKALHISDRFTSADNEISVDTETLASLPAVEVVKLNKSSDIHAMPGQGDINFEAVAESLRTIGYDGVLNYELNAGKVVEDNGLGYSIMQNAQVIFGQFKVESNIKLAENSSNLAPNNDNFACTPDNLA